jgi:hypothetical protein
MIYRIKYRSSSPNHIETVSTGFVHSENSIGRRLMYEGNIITWTNPSCGCIREELI